MPEKTHIPLPAADVRRPRPYKISEINIRLSTFATNEQYHQMCGRANVVMLPLLTLRHYPAGRCNPICRSMPGRSRFPRSSGPRRRDDYGRNNLAVRCELHTTRQKSEGWSIPEPLEPSQSDSAISHQTTRPKERVARCEIASAHGDLPFGPGMRSQATAATGTFYGADQGGREVMRRSTELRLAFPGDSNLLVKRHAGVQDGKRYRARASKARTALPARFACPLKLRRRLRGKRINSRGVANPKTSRVN